MKNSLLLMIGILISVMIGGIVLPFLPEKDNYDVAEQNIIDSEGINIAKVQDNNAEIVNQETNIEENTVEKPIEVQVTDEIKTEDKTEKSTTKVTNKSTTKKETVEETKTKQPEQTQSTNKKVENTKKEETETKPVVEQPKNEVVQEQPKSEETKVVLDFSKYDRYYPALNRRLSVL